MQNTPNYNFNLPEGTDLWNYLTQTNPNFTALDTILKSVSDATVTTATEVTSGTAHAVTRTLPDANVIRFTATSVWTLGDTMTIDGTPVTVVKPNGTSLQTGDYIIGSEVLGVLRATQFTVYVGGASSLDASDVTYDNTGSGLTATDVQAAIDEEAAAINTINSNLVERTVPYTLTGGWAVASSDGVVFSVKNGVAVFNFSVWQNNAISANTWVTVGSITNAEDRPTINTYCPCLLDSTTITNALMRITPQGDIEIKVVSTQSAGIKVFKGCLSYIVN